jgi:hypothetical protein
LHGKGCCLAFDRWGDANDLLRTSSLMFPPDLSEERHIVGISDYVERPPRVQREKLRVRAFTSLRGRFGSRIHDCRRRALCRGSGGDAKKT